ncbi:MAG: hypothetical protein K0S12_1013 [Bacteroidetes bacterium]|jgi:hypothetical protein|nr:hypothetical protein [Bacteroidota bacterium]
MIKKISLLLLVFLTGLLNAQTPEPQMADAFRADGKIYVVITVIGMIFVALVIFMVILERKLKKLENKIKS